MAGSQKILFANNSARFSLNYFFQHGDFRFLLQELLIFLRSKGKRGIILNGLLGNIIAVLFNEIHSQRIWDALNSIFCLFLCKIAQFLI